MSDVTITPKEERAYGYIIEVLSSGLYPNKFHVIREYVQNSFDAIKNFKDLFGGKKSLRIKVSIKKPSIFIYDNGTGMDRCTLNEYKNVGFSKKKIGEYAGFRGIGKLSGLSVAKKLIITTSPYKIGEKYILTFDAEGMIKEIENLKKSRKNIPLTDLIEKYTKIEVEKEEKNAHYTLIELNGIKNDSKILLDQNKLIDYLGKNAPVRFEPKFKFGDRIETEIKKFVDDYDYTEICVGNKPVYKKFPNDVKDPMNIVIWDKAQKKILGYCWYCENKAKGQIKPVNESGLVYRYKNFAVGDNSLTRKTLWSVSPHLAFYFVGEIYLCDCEIKPTSQRDDFEEDKYSERFYSQAKIIANNLNRIARESSGERRALHYVSLGKEIIDKITEDIINNESYLQEMKTQKIAEVFNVVINVKNRMDYLPEEDKKSKLLANQIITNGNKVLKELEKIDTNKPLKIEKNVELSGQSLEVYKIIIEAIKNHFSNSGEELEEIIKIIHKNLKNHFSNVK